MNPFLIDEAASQEIRRIFSLSKCRDPVAEIIEVASRRLSGFRILPRERAEIRSEYLREVSGIMFVVGPGVADAFRGLCLTFAGNRFPPQRSRQHNAHFFPIAAQSDP